MNELEYLKNENNQMKQEITKYKENLKEYYKINYELIKMVETNILALNELQYGLIQAQANQYNLKYEIIDTISSGHDLFYPQFRTDEETIRLIVEEKKSLARFGDGEFSIAFNIVRQKFQRVDEKLASRIKQVITSNQDGLLIAIANQYGNLDKFNPASADAIRHYMSADTRNLHEELLDKDRIYSDAYITRFYVQRDDMFSEAPAKRFAALQKIWDKKKIIIIEGEQTRLGMGNDLFSNAASIQRILAPATSSFDRYDDLLNAAIQNRANADLFILAIGPSSGVLAYDLTIEGIQAVDVGHIDLEYEWFLAGKGIRVPVPNKYNNELLTDDKVTEQVTDDYLQQIIYKFL